jgi:hypothetical protein|tara:strand:- start:2507 stop:2764 length:258 start_codon:yes stop_codon:yes gene_type:complete
MSVNFQQLAPILAACMTTGGVIFQIGKQSERLEVIGLKVEAQGKKEEYYNQSINKLLGTMDVLKNDVNNIKEDIRDIKDYMKKSK